MATEFIVISHSSDKRCLWSDQSLAVREAGSVHTHHLYARPSQGELTENPTPTSLSPTAGVHPPPKKQELPMSGCPWLGG